MKSKLIEYYQKRAAEYEIIYEKKERQKDLKKIKSFLSNQFVNKNIIEIACGTGYWTEIIAKQAKSILATDINQEVLDIAQSKDYAKARVHFKRIDYRKLNASEALFDGLFAGFIWSHILIQNLAEFVQHTIELLNDKGQIIFLDNKFVPGSSTPITRKDSNGNTYQNRQLLSGENYGILKNFPTKVEVIALFKAQNCTIKWIELQYYWMLECKKNDDFLAKCQPRNFRQ